MSLNSIAKTGFSTTIAGAGISGTAEILDVTLPSLSRADIKTTHAATVGAHTYIPGDLIEGGQLTFDIAFSGARPATAEGHDPTSYVITLPGGSWTFNGYINNVAPRAPLEDRMTATIGVKVASAPVFAPTPEE